MVDVMGNDSQRKYRIEVRIPSDNVTPTVFMVEMTQVVDKVLKLFEEHPEIQVIDVVYPDGRRFPHPRPSTAPVDEKMETPAAPVADAEEAQAAQPSEPVSLSKKIKKKLKKLIPGLHEGDVSSGQSTNR